MPIYCETALPWMGIAEPVNFFTNGFIILAAIFASILMLRARPARPAGLWLLIVLLYMTGIGSALWHGLRTHWALRLDSLSGLAFLLVLIGLWAGTLWGRMRGFFATCIFLAGAAGLVTLSITLMGQVGEDFRPVLFVPFFLWVVLTGLVLIRGSYRRAGRKAARLAGFTVLCGIIAAIARSIDFYVCAVVPFGSHFLWHTFLALAAWLAIRALMALEASDAESRLHGADG